MIGDLVYEFFDPCDPDGESYYDPRDAELDAEAADAERQYEAWLSLHPEEAS